MQPCHCERWSGDGRRGRHRHIATRGCRDPCRAFASPTSTSMLATVLRARSWAARPMQRTQPMTLSSRRGGTGHSSATRQRFEQWFDRILVNLQDRLRRTKRVPFGDLPSDLTTPGADRSDRSTSVMRWASLWRGSRRITEWWSPFVITARPSIEIAATLGVSAGTVSSRLHRVAPPSQPAGRCRPRPNASERLPARTTLRAWFREEIGPTEAARRPACRDIRGRCDSIAALRSRRFVVLLAAAMHRRDDGGRLLAIGSGWSSFRGPATWNRQHRLCRRPPPARTGSPSRAWTGAPMAVARADTAALLLDGTLLAAGGRSGPTGAVDDGGALRPAKRCLDSNGKHGRPASRARRHAAAGRNGPGNGRSGQQRPTPGVGGAVRPRHWTWSLTGDMTGSRIGHTATLLADGSVLVAGAGEGGMGSGRQKFMTPSAGPGHQPSAANARSQPCRTDRRQDLGGRRDHQ